MPRSASARLLTALAGCLAAAALGAVGAAPSYAITSGGTADDGRYASVGGLVPQEGFSRVTCSGTLINARTVLMAAHCRDGLLARNGHDQAFVTFDPEYVPGVSTLLPGRMVSHPDYTQAKDDPNDLAVFLLDSPVIDRAPVTVAGLGVLTTSRDLRGATFTVAGYGTEELGAGQVRQGNNVREYATSLYRTHTDGVLKLDQNQATGHEGTCYADSGGPAFDASGVQVAVTISGDTMCKATGIYQRLDTASAQAFLQPYVS